jgi:NADPH2:quinone reductase
MKAIILERHGPPEVLREISLRISDPGPDELIIWVQASGVNFADLLQRAGLYASAPKLPYILGFEAAGEVISCGESVKRFSPGDRVVALVRTGGYGQKIVVPERAVFPLPEGISYEVGAAIPVNYLTAWFCLRTMGNLRPGERVLIHSAAGGVGIAAVQIAREVGAEIFATAGSKDKVLFLEKIGVQHPINYREANFADRIEDITLKEGVDLILDPIGGRTTLHNRRILAPLGRLVLYGLASAMSHRKRNWFRALWAWAQTPRFDLYNLIGRNIGVFGFHLALLGSKETAIAEAFTQIIDRVVGGRFAPVVAERFPLSQQGAIAAHEFLHERRNIGKVVLVPDG